MDLDVLVHNVDVSLTVPGLFGGLLVFRRQHDALRLVRGVGDTGQQQNTEDQWRDPPVRSPSVRVGLIHESISVRFIVSRLPSYSLSAPYNGRVRYLAVDPGGRRMGLAVGDDTTGVVSPLEIVEYPGAAAGARLIADTAARAGAVTVVIGLPTLEDGSVASAGRRTDRVAEELRALGVDVALQSEFLTTNEARRRARMAGRSPRLPG